MLVSLSLNTLYKFVTHLFPHHPDLLQAQKQAKDLAQSRHLMNVAWRKSDLLSTYDREIFYNSLLFMKMI